ncbi:MAG: hypothetical protein M9964_05785 [Solirubrobacterales bacterium]|nr:hypothetical protein [Solirubrobacterales bacterium]
MAASRAERRLILSGVYDDSDLGRRRSRDSRTALGCLLPALGVDGEGQTRIRMPAPEAREGLDHDEGFQDVEAVVRVIGPEPSPPPAWPATGANEPRPRPPGKS